ncbi:PREDICTED: uncharacterized protein LOC101291637 [Fragaria vesca subsp. vesca]|uniref:uncharacterized protein LOC101291637 n=1 Tax=Fragaria vesca subsp. vesca TaxID=101020 RepID=UPI0002C2F462|nr:PREDICTED: uncharacterized protein LOC101291637 [Fragaria vesca subsp. vesca]
MACLVSMAFSMPLSASHTFTNEVALRKSGLDRVSSRRISGTAAKHSASCNTNGAISSSNRSCRHLLSTTAKPLCEILYSHMNVDSCSHMIIHGYWEGPDIDDGCGYVEAFVNQIT